MAVIVFGSINMDLVARTPRLPAPAETITGHEFFTAPGGKGANQAVAAARLGVTTWMVGRVGGDSFGADLQQNLQATGVNTAAVLVDEDVSSGVAVIAVDDAAQNNIIIVPGANGRVGQADVDRLASLLLQAGVLLLQLEVPLDATIAAAKLARQHNVTVVLDPAPAQELPPELYFHLDYITPNEVEVAQLVGFAVKSKQDGMQAAAALVAKGVNTAIVKMGAVGVCYATQTNEGVKQGCVDAFTVKAVDTVAAGDAFNGVFAAALDEDLALLQAIRWGAAAGALSATKTGAQPSMPSREEFDRFLLSVGL